MGKVGTGFGLNFEETFLTAKLYYTGPQQVTYKATIPHDGIVLIAASTAASAGDGATGVWVVRNGRTVAWNKSVAPAAAASESGGGSSVSANLVVKKNDDIAITIRNTLTESDAFLTVLSTAGKLEFTKS